MIDIEELNERILRCYESFRREDSLSSRKKLAYAFIDVCSVFADLGDLVNFENNFNKIRDLKIFDQFPDISNSIAFLFPILTLNASSKIKNKPELLDDVFFMMRELVLNKPSEEYSQLLKAIHPFRTIWKGYKEFCRWWKFSNFSNTDYVTIVNDEPGIDGCSLAESALITFTQRVMNTQFKEDLARLTMLFIENSQKHNFSLYSNFYIARLFLKLGICFNLIQRVLRPFVIEYYKNPFAWYYLSKTFPNSRFIDKYSCLLMSLDCAENFDGDLVPGIFLDTAFVLKVNGNLDVAKYYFEKFVDCKKSTDSAIPTYISAILNENWYKSTQSVPTELNFDFKGNCRGILRSLKDADREVWASLYRFARDKNMESVDWNC
ncbi:MAG: hypothetical protein IKQ46_05285 [Bacteroidales bacterium]|nr:hypothetical protein [Bacteroidales bacterium]